MPERLKIEWGKFQPGDRPEGGVGSLCVEVLLLTTDPHLSLQRPENGNDVKMEGDSSSYS